MNVAVNIPARPILLDANIIILFFNERDKPKKERSQSTNDFIELFQKENVKFAVTPLVCYEVLRGAKTEDDFKKMKKLIKYFENFDINQEISDLAAKIYQQKADELSKNNPESKPDKRSFDICHFASAKCLNLDFLSQDKEIEGYEEIYTELTS